MSVPRKSGTERVQKPRVKGADILGTSELARQISSFCRNFGREQYLQIAEAAKGQPGTGKVKVPAGLFAAGVKNEQAIMAGLGWYWEPLFHDLSFLEQMRDSIPLLSGAYQKFTDMVMDGFAIHHDDPEVVKRFEDALLWSQVDFDEVLRSTIFDLLTIANAYRKPVYETTSKGLTVKTLRPVRATAIRKLRDADLVTEGYVQLLHRPSEFIFGGTPTVPTVYLADEMLMGWAFSKDWYAYGVPPLSSLPFITKMKIQMERDLVELLHQHVPRIDITYTPDEQMSQEQVDASIDDVRADVKALQPNDSFVHTPDTAIEYKGPLGKALDFSGGTNHVEDQFFAVLPLGPHLLGRTVTWNPIMAEQVWRLSCVLANRLRARAYIMFRPMLEKLATDWGVETPTFGFTDLDAETASTQAQTDEYQIQNASAMRDAGYISQDDAAKHATQRRKGGPVRAAAEDGPLPPVVDPNKPAGGGATTGASGKVRNKDKGPKGQNRSAPTPDKRTRGKRHETPMDDLFDAAEDEIDSLGER